MGSNEKMKIMHIWNVAAVGYELAKEFNSMGHNTVLIDHHKDVRKEILYAGLKEPWYFKMSDYNQMWSVIMSKLVHWKPEVVHIHALDVLCERIKDFYPHDIPIVLTYHGTDIRGQWEERKAYYRTADLITVSTSDLLVGAPTDTIHVCNPVSIGHWRNKALVSRRKKHALFVWNYQDKHAYKIALEGQVSLGVAMDIQDRSEVIFPYVCYPWVLAGYEYYFDIKGKEGELYSSMSLTGLQALAAGAKVWHNNWLYTEFPHEYSSTKVARKWLEIYRKLLE